MTTQNAPSLEGRSKRYRAAAPTVDRTTIRTPQDAVALIKQTATAKFDETVEAHLRTTVDPRKQNQPLRGVVALPHGLGKTVRVLVFAQGDVLNAAKAAGADYVGDEETIQKIERDGWTDFDVAIATPDVMGRIGRLGRVLGRKGLMPNPRTGTVVPPQDLAKAIGEAKRGRLEFRMDRTAIVHSPIGKRSFSDEQLVENLAALVDAVNKARPEGIKGPLLKSLYLTSTMGPSVKVDIAQAATLQSD
ncbi:MAG: 50S ribosomal protein L1 [SAR202 cluster bacterium]|nr:50S ribosomal protein L1 [SAR202 cluster bacterium]